DPNRAEAHTTRGLIRHCDLDFKGAEEEFKKAIELKPSYATAHQWYFQILEAESRWDEALKQIEKAVELDPFSQMINLNHAMYYDSRTGYAKALELGKKAVELNPGFAYAHLQLAETYAKMKSLDDAKRQSRIGVELVQAAYPHALKRMKALLAYLGDDKEAVRRLLPGLEANLGRPLTATATDTAAY